MRPLITLCLAGAFALGAMALVAHRIVERRAAPVLASGASQRFEGSLMPPGVRAPDFTLTDQDGSPIRMRDVRGRPAIVTFLYTHCEESCPAEAMQIKGALDDLGHDVPALAVAVDPPNDTPASARAFLAKSGMTGRMDFAIGSRRELQPVWKGFAVQPQLRHSEHQARIVLIDARGFQRIGFPLSETTPERIAHDVRELERESS
jgi:protein SCO1